MISQQSTVILIADHEDNWRDLLIMVLQRCGYQVTEAKTGLEAIDRAVAATPSLILLDSALPDINGYEVLARLARNPATQKIPVFLQLPEAGAHDVPQPLGVKEVLYKPFDLGDLPGLLRKYLPEPPLGITAQSMRVIGVR
jgi:CheY-like chemotaxis protein